MSSIAIVGANGLVGNKLTDILVDKLPQHKLLLFGKTSVGQKITTLGKSFVIRDMNELHNCDYAMFMANENVARQYLPPLANNGTVCIDNSSAFRMQKGVPLVVPQINSDTVGCCKLIANPNCTTIQVAIALNALKSLQIQSVTVVTMQSVSGAGKEALDDLENQNSYGKLKSFTHPIYDNIIPQIGDILEDGSTKEEQKLKQELPKILNFPLSVNSFCVRVPITVGHCAFVNVKFAQQFTIEQVKELLKKEKDVLLFDDKENCIFPMPQVLRHTHFVGVGRLCLDNNGGLNMFVVADNLLRGAAYNAYQILKIALKNNGDN